MFPSLLAELDREAIVIFIICVIFLVLFCVAGIRDILARKDDEG